MEPEKKEMRGYENTTLEKTNSETIITENEEGVNKVWKLLGHTRDLEYVFYRDGEVFTIDPDRFTTTKMQILFGITEDEAKRIRKKLPIKASFNEVDVKNTIGSGVFRSSEYKDSFVIVNGSKVIYALYDINNHGHNLQIDDTPIVDGKLLDLKGNKEWLNADKLFEAQENIIEARKNIIDENELPPEVKTLRKQFEVIKKVVSCWNWESPEMADYITAFVMLAPFQRLMTWRPTIWITGYFGTGKTKFFELVLEKLYKKDGLVKRLDNSTDYGAIQQLNSTSVIPLFDNFEPTKKASKLLETFEIANRGGTVTRGTPSKTPITFTIEHMPWYNAVLLVPETGATDSRIVEFKLVGKPKSVQELPSEVSAEKIIYSMLEIWDNLEELKQLYVDDNKSRDAENIGYAHALLGLLEVIDIDAMDLSFLDVPNFIKTRATVDESMELLKAILTSSVLPDDASDYSEQAKKFVYEAIQESSRSIVRKGVWKVHDRDGTDWIAIEPTSVKRELLKAPEYTQRTPEQIKKMLLNLEGSKVSPSKGIANEPLRVVLIPSMYIEQIESLHAPNVAEEQKNKSDLK